MVRSIWTIITGKTAVCFLEAGFHYNNGALVGVINRGAEWYDLHVHDFVHAEKIKPMEFEAEYQFCLWLCHLCSSEHYIAGIEKKSRRINQSQCSILNIAINQGWLFPFCFQLRQSSFHNQMERFWFFRLWFFQAYDSTYNYDFQFSPGHNSHLMPPSLTPSLLSLY